MRIYDADADREVGGRESRVQMTKAPRGGEGGKDEGGWDGREDRLLKRIRIVGRSDHKFPLS